jgi:hypothetical protein
MTKTIDKLVIDFSSELLICYLEVESTDETAKEENNEESDIDDEDKE